MNFKKGDKVTKIASWDSTGTVYVQHFIVSSWGKKQGTLLRVDDGSNAKFRVYTQHTDLVQGLGSQRMIPTADYSDERALEIAQEFIDSENERAEARYAHNVARFENKDTVYFGGDRDSNMKFEQAVYDQHKAVPWKAAIK